VIRVAWMILVVPGLTQRTRAREVLNDHLVAMTGEGVGWGRVVVVVVVVVESPGLRNGTSLAQVKVMPGGEDAGISIKATHTEDAPDEPLPVGPTEAVA
jgi:hypothetical protein